MNDLIPYRPFPIVAPSSPDALEVMRAAQNDRLAHERTMAVMRASAMVQVERARRRTAMADNLTRSVEAWMYARPDQHELSIDAAEKEGIFSSGYRMSVRVRSR